jgi:hypothetical protein
MNSATASSKPSSAIDAGASTWPAASAAYATAANSRLDMRPTGVYTWSPSDPSVRPMNAALPAMSRASHSEPGTPRAASASS